jgi:hypothetical protein
MLIRGGYFTELEIQAIQKNDNNKNGPQGIQYERLEYKEDAEEHIIESKQTITPDETNLTLDDMPSKIKIIKTDLEAITHRLREYILHKAQSMQDTTSIPTLRRADKNKLKETTKLLNEAMRDVTAVEITQLRKIYQAAALIACEMLDVKTSSTNDNKRKTNKSKNSVA